MHGHVIFVALPRELDRQLVTSKITELMLLRIALEEFFHQIPYGFWFRACIWPSFTDIIIHTYRCCFIDDRQGNF